MDKHNAKTRKKLKQISSVKDFESLMEQTMLSEEEKKILWLHYKEQKTMAFIGFLIGVANYEENLSQSDVQDMIKGALRDVHEHLEEQDNKIDHIIELLEGGKGND